MAKLGYEADPTDLPEKNGDFPLLAPGDYTMQAINCEIRDTKKGGQMAVWEFIILDGPLAGRKLWDNVNIANPPGYVQTGKADPADIGRKHNNQFAAAIGLTTGADDTDNYLFKPVKCVVKVQKGTNDYPDSNGISAFKPVSGGEAPRAATSGNAGAGGAATASGGGKPKAYKNPETGKWHDENGELIKFYDVSKYEKIEG